MKAVLFVCTANMCRSPMAQGLFQAQLGVNLDGWRVESAGIAAVEGVPASQKTLQVLSERGIDLSVHRSQQIDRYLMEQFDLILVMEHRHKHVLQSQYPQFASKVYLLSEMVGEETEIDDPVGGTLEDYRSIATQIERILQQGFSKIEALTG
ncbi:MAG: low molecular weight protein arginine phosphatase [Anaerolineales bacterium]